MARIYHPTFGPEKISRIFLCHRLHRIHSLPLHVAGLSSRICYVKSTSFSSWNEKVGFDIPPMEIGRAISVYSTLHASKWLVPSPILDHLCFGQEFPFNKQIAGKLILANQLQFLQECFLQVTRPTNIWIELICFPINGLVIKSVSLAGNAPTLSWLSWVMSDAAAFKKSKRF